MPTVISIDYDILGVDPVAARSLSADLAQLAPTRIRPINKERGGWETVLWVVVSYVGLKLVDALVDQVAGKFVASVGDKIRSFFRSEQSRGWELCISLRFAFDDVDVEIILPSDATDDFLQATIREVAEHLQSAVLRERSIRYVLIPVEYQDDSWEPLGGWLEADHQRCIWGLGAHHFPFVTEAYDPLSRGLVEPGDEDSRE